MNPELENYRWLTADSQVVNFDEYCLTTVTNARIDRVLAALAGHVVLHEAATYSELQELTEDTSGPVAGIVQLDSAVLIYEDNGFQGVRSPAVQQLSDGGAVVSHYVGGHGVRRFVWFQDDSLRASFEPPMAWTSEGPRARELVALMRQVGQFMFEDGDEVPDYILPATFLLAERLTGVRIAPAVFEDASYTVVGLPRLSG